MADYILELCQNNRSVSSFHDRPFERAKGATPKKWQSMPQTLPPAYRRCALNPELRPFVWGYQDNTAQTVFKILVGVRDWNSGEGNNGLIELTVHETVDYLTWTAENQRAVLSRRRAFWCRPARSSLTSAPPERNRRSGN